MRSVISDQLKGLDLGDISVDDERGRSDVDEGAVASITFSGDNGNVQWGEFLTYEQAARIYFWLGQLLGDRP